MAINRRRALFRAGYGAAVVACLAVWLLPLAGVALTSLHSIDELNRGKLWSWPGEFQ